MQSSPRGRRHREAPIICDVDEVLVHFLQGFEAYLGEHDLWLDARSFALTGNVLHRETGLPVAGRAVLELLHGFFSERTALLAPIPHAAESLRELSNHAGMFYRSTFGMVGKLAQRLRRMGNGGEQGGTL